MIAWTTVILQCALVFSMVSEVSKARISFLLHKNKVGVFCRFNHCTGIACVHMGKGRARLNVTKYVLSVGSQ